MAPNSAIRALDSSAMVDNNDTIQAQTEREDFDGDDDEDEDEDEDEEEAPSHLPFAPSSELSEISSTTIDPSYVISLIRKLLPRDVGNAEKENGIEGEEKCGGGDDGGSGASKDSDPWEECGCVLWDLSANKSHAEFMVNNLLLDVLVANLQISESLRITEICLGIIGNLACHDFLSISLVSTKGLTEAVVQQLFVDDSTCLSEAFRLLSAGLQGNQFLTWAEALLPDQVLLRILWIIGNTLNSTLLEKSIDFLLTIINNHGVSSILVQPMVKLGFPSLVTSLLAGEMSKLGDENKLERSSILDQVLGLVEAISSNDNYSQLIISNEELTPLVCGVVKLPDKIEVASSCVSVVVIIANLLLDVPNLTLKLSQDFSFLHGLLDILPFLSDDPQARNAFWCIMTRLLGQVQENDIDIAGLQQFASLFADKSGLIEEDIENHALEDFGGSPNTHDGHKSHAIATSLRRIVCILEKWIFERPHVSEGGIGDVGDQSNKRLYKLLDCCHKYLPRRYSTRILLTP